MAKPEATAPLLELTGAGADMQKRSTLADCVKTQPAKVKNKCPDLSGHLFF